MRSVRPGRTPERYLHPTLFPWKAYKGSVMREAGRILMVFKNTSPLKAFTPWPLEAPMDMGQRGAAGSLKGEGVGRGRPSCGEANEADPGMSVMYYRDWSALGFWFLFALKKYVGITSMWNRRRHCFVVTWNLLLPFIGNPFHALWLPKACSILLAALGLWGHRDWGGGNCTILIFISIAPA